MLKINSKKKVNKPANTLKPQFAQKKPLVQPEWNATNSDLDRYRLSKAEQVQKKVSLISKHRYEAKELWLQRQEKLKRGIVDEETQTVLETCLSTKRPPEKNMKNLTYFIKDDTYAEYLDQAYEESEEKRLSVMDLHPQEKSEIKEIKPVKTREEKPKVEKKQDLDEGDDFIRKVNESLKDARDFMTKIERYPSITKAKDPERALKTLATADKENNSTKKKPAVVNTTNLKSSLGNSQNGKRTSNLNSSSGFKETSPQLPKVEEKETYKPKYVVEEPPKEVYAAEEKDNKEDISTYFKSLNQIEDTIKFLEENIIGGGSAAPEKKEYNYELLSMPKANERFGFGFGLDDYKSPAVAENKYRGDDSLEKSAEKEEDSYFKKREEDSYFKKRGASPSHSDIKHHHDHEEELSRDHTDHHEHHDDHDEHDDEQISFALTMKSNDHTERNLDHDHHDDYKPGYASKLFGFDDMISPVATTLQKPFPIALHSPPEYPQTIFENKAIQERTRTQNIKPQSPPKMEVRPQAQHHEEEEEEEDEEEFNIERIKGLLQATKLEIEKMNTDKMESYNNSYKTALEDMDKENVSNNRGGFGTTTYNKFDNPVMGKKIEVVKNDAFVTVKQPFNALWENQRKVLADTRDMYDDDIPAPQTLDIKKQAVAATYSPKKFDDMPLNFRSFRK